VELGPQISESTQLSQFTVEEIAVKAEVSIDTIRFYQTKGLLPLPAKRGRRAVYDQSHLERLALVKSMAERGLSLKAIAMLIDRGADSSDRALLAAIEEDTAAPAYSSAEMAKKLGIPLAVLRSIEATGLSGEADDGGHHYSDSDVHSARGALDLVRFGFPLPRLIALAVRHDRATRKTVDEAIELFDKHIRKAKRVNSQVDSQGISEDDDGEAVAKAFKEILPVVTAIIAHHFQRLLIRRALKRLRNKGDSRALKVAVEVASKNKVNLKWR